MKQQQPFGKKMKKQAKINSKTSEMEHNSKNATPVVHYLRQFLLTLFCSSERKRARASKI